MTSAKEALRLGAVLAVVNLHLMYSPRDPNVFFWQYNSTFIKRLDEEELPRATVLEFCKRMSALQLIWINHTVTRGSLTRQQWEDILTPCSAHEYCYCMPNISHHEFKKDGDRLMKNSSGLERARMLIDYACSLDLARKIAEVGRLAAHPTIVQWLKAVKANAVTVRRSLPNFLWWADTTRPGLRTRNWRMYHRDCYAKLLDLKQAIVERGATAYQELLQAYSIGQLANIIHTVLTFEWINPRQHLRWLSKEQLAKALVKWAGLDKPAVEVRWVDILEVSRESQVEFYRRNNPETIKWLNDKSRERTPTMATRWGYLRRAVKGAIRRLLEPVVGASGTRWREEEEKLLAIVKVADYDNRLERYEVCQVLLTTTLVGVYHGHKTGTATRLFSNISLDARIPRCAGGSYVDDNVAFVCVACNFCKLGFPKANALKLIDAFVKADWSVEDGWLRPSMPAPRPALDDDDLAFIRT